MRRQMFVCPECGPRVGVDEDGTCRSCGADCAVATYVPPSADPALPPEPREQTDRPSSSLLSPGEEPRFQRPRDGKLEEVSLSEFLQWADESSEQIAHLSDGKSWTIHLLVRGLRSFAQALQAATERERELRLRAVMSEQHKALSLMGRSSYAEVVEDKLRTQLAECQLALEAATERAEHAEALRVEALAYLSRLLVSVAPQCEPLPDLLGVCTQIDNLIVGLKEVTLEELSELRKR